VLALAFPVVLTNTLVGQNGFLTASLIGGMLYLLPRRGAGHRRGVPDAHRLAEGLARHELPVLGLAAVLR
jgi:hypothetical protein